jgi:hypothetical protein
MNVMVNSLCCFLNFDDGYKTYTYDEFCEILPKSHNIELIVIVTANFRLKSLKDALQVGSAKIDKLVIRYSILDYAYLADWLQSPDFPFFKVGLLMDEFSDKVFDILKIPGLKLNIFEFICSTMIEVDFNSFCNKLAQNLCYFREVNVEHGLFSAPKVVIRQLEKCLLKC